MVNIRNLIDDAKCFQSIREMHWPEVVTCPHCLSDDVIKDGPDDTRPNRQRHLCHGCHRRFDDLTAAIFAGYHEPLCTWIICLYFMGLNLSSLQIAKELDMNRSDVQAMIQQLRQGIVDAVRQSFSKGRSNATKSMW
jgi:transposase-like protein